METKIDSNTSYIKIKPNDTLFFRDGKPFDDEESQCHESMVYPNPSVLYGAIFSEILRQNTVLETKLLESKAEEAFQYLELKNIYLMHKDDIYIKAPLDIFVDKEGRNIQYGHMKEDENKKILMYKPPGYEEFQRADNYWIKYTLIKNSYAYKNTNMNLIRENDFYNTTHKLGIQMNPNLRVAENSKLYQLEMIEFKDSDWSYLIEVNIAKDVQLGNGKSKNIRLEGQGILKLGGEGKTATYQRLKEIPYDLYIVEKWRKEFIVKSKVVKLLLITPYHINKEKFKSEGIEVLGIISGKPLKIGGFDLKTNKHKPITSFRPAGSLYILKSEKFEKMQGHKNSGKSVGENSLKNIEKFIENLLSEDNKTKNGYGSFLIMPYEED